MAEFDADDWPAAHEAATCANIHRWHPVVSGNSVIEEAVPLAALAGCPLHDIVVRWRCLAAGAPCPSTSAFGLTDLGPFKEHAYVLLRNDARMMTFLVSHFGTEVARLISLADATAVVGEPLGHALPSSFGPLLKVARQHADECAHAPAPPPSRGADDVSSPAARNMSR